MSKPESTDEFYNQLPQINEPGFEVFVGRRGPFSPAIEGLLDSTWSLG